MADDGVRCGGCDPGGSTDDDHDPSRREVLRRIAAAGAAVTAAGAVVGGLLDGAAAASAPTGAPPAVRPPARPARRTVSSRTVAVPAPAILPRSAWGARESWRTGEISFSTPTRFVVHHTDTPNTTRNPPELYLRTMYEMHTQVRKDADLAYNFVIARDGRIFEGRWARNYAAGEVHDGENGAGKIVTGAHTLGANEGTCGIALLGTYATAAPTPAALDALVALVAWKAARWKVDPTASTPYVLRSGKRVVAPTIAGHRAFVQTTCPGGALNAALASVRTRVAERLARGAG